MGSQVGLRKNYYEQSFSRSVVSGSLQPHKSQHARPPCPSPSPKVCPHSCPLHQWCHPAISSSDILFSCPQSFPVSQTFPMSQLFALGGQRIGASVSVLPKNIQHWFSLGWTGLISLQSKELPRVFSNTTVQKHQFFGVQPSLQATAWCKRNFYMYWETKQSLFALLWWSGTEATVSLRYACTETNCQINGEDEKIPTSKVFVRIKWACTERNRKCFNTMLST